jgi:hypothetical protein
MDYGYVDWGSDPVVEVPDMATTIVRVYTREGFVIAADGREYDPNADRILGENVRKVFTVTSGQQQLTYALSGTNILVLKNGKVEFDIVPAIHKAVAKASAENHDNLEAYGTALVGSFRELPARENDKPTIILLDGYINGVPQQARVDIYHDGKEAERFLEHLSGGFAGGFGSSIILRMLNRLVGADAGPMEQYRSASWDVPLYKRTLPQAIEIAKSWMDAHCSPEALGIDLTNCRAMGGNCHLCINTPTKDFEWMWRDPQTGLWTSCDAPTGANVR